MSSRQASTALGIGRRVRQWALRHPYWTVFVVAFVLRVVAAIVIWSMFGGSLFLDDRTYVDMAVAWAEDDTASWRPYTSWLFNRTLSLLVPLGVLYKIIGPSMLAGQLLVAVFGALTAVLVARLLHLTLGRRHALAGGLLIGIWPSAVVFSATVMKDALAWAALAGLAVVTARLNRSRGREIFVFATFAALLLLFLGHIRVHTTVAAAWAFALAVLLARPHERLRRWSSALVVTLIVPWIVTAGPFGVQMTTAVPELDDIRAFHSTGGSAVPAARRDAEQVPAPPGDGSTADSSRPGPGVPAPSTDGRNASIEEAVGRNIAYLPTGLTVMLFEPLPWRSSDSAVFQLARVENVAWYLVLLLAAVGAWRGVVTHRDAFLFPLFAGGSTLVMWSLVEGNMGTAYRHRGEFGWAVMVFAVVGTSVLIERVRSRGEHSPAETAIPVSAGNDTMGDVA